MTNPHPEDRFFFFFQFDMPVPPFADPYTVDAILFVDLTDGSSDDVVTLTGSPLQQISALQGETVTSIGFFSGNDLGSDLETTLGTLFDGDAAAGPAPFGSFDGLSHFVSFELSPGDTAVLRGKAIIDAGAGGNVYRAGA